MESDGFKWWCNRVRESFKMYDILRIDHFRGFAGYYNIPYGHPTARYGKWSDAPGIALFRTIRKNFPKAKIIAEDLITARRQKSPGSFVGSAVWYLAKSGRGMGRRCSWVRCAAAAFIEPFATCMTTGVRWIIGTAGCRCIPRDKTEHCWKAVGW